MRGPGPWPLFRSLTAADLESWLALQRTCLPDPFSRDALRDELDAVHSRHLGLVRGGRVVAAFLGWLVVDELQILQVVVDPSQRRSGLGRALVDHALRRARAGGAITATLEVRAGNRAAVGLYASLGFVQDGLRPRYYPDGEDAVLMRIDLTR